MTTQTSYVAEIDAWTGFTVETLRISTHGFATLPSDIPASVSYDGCISDVGAIQRSIFQNTEVQGDPRISEGYIEIANTGRFDTWLNYGFDGRVFVVYRLAVANLYSSRRRVFTGNLIGIDASNAWTKLRLLIRDRLQELDRPFLTVRYAGTTTSTGLGIEGNAELKDQLKPLIIGSQAKNVTPKIVNPFDLLYQVSSQPVTFIQVKVGGTSISSAGNVLTLAALMSATIPSGQYMTCYALGIFRLADSPAAVITADVIEGVRSCALIAYYILQLFGVPDSSIDLASVTAAHTFNTNNAGIYLDSDESVLQVVSRVLDSVGCAIIPSTDGLYTFVIMQDPSALTPVTEFTVQNIRDGTSVSLLTGSGSSGVPPYSVVLKYNVNYTPMDLSQLAGILTEAEKTALTEPNKTVIAKDVAILFPHPLATEITKDTLFETSDAATAEATRLLNMLKVRRDRIDVTMHDEDADGVELGDCVKLTLSRFGFDSGKKFLVLGRTDEFRTRSVVLNLWG